MLERVKIYLRKALVRAAVLSKRIRQKASSFAEGHPWIKRTVGYVALVALLAILGSASYAYRARREANYASEPPQAALAVHTPEPTPQPTPEPATWRWPLEGEILVEYEEREPVWSDTLMQWQTHPALDIAGAPGEAVYACRDGVVADAWTDRLWGNVIAIDHGDGWESLYAGLNTLNLVSVGDSVSMGDVISAVGTSVPCEAERPAHIHFALTRNGKTVDIRELMDNF